MCRVSKAICCFVLALALIVPCLMIPFNAAKAAPYEMPRVTGVRVLNPDVQKPGVVYLEVDFTESGIGIEYITLDFLGADSARYLTSSTYLEGASAYSGTVKVSLPVPTGAREDVYVLSTVHIKDRADNHMTYVGGSGDFLYGTDGFTSQDEGNKLQITEFRVTDEFDVDMDVGLSNPQLITRLVNMPEGKTAKIMIDDWAEYTIPGAAFDAIRGRDKTIVLYKDALQWVFKGQDITKPSKNVVLNVSLQPISGLEFGVSEQLYSVQFHPNGELPGKATIRLKSDYLYNLQGITGTLYLYHETEDGLEEEEGNFNLVLNGEDKWCYFDVTHNSRFIISGKKIKPTIAVKSVSLNKNQLKIYPGKSTTLKATVSPDNATNKKVSWKSSDIKIATVKNGVVTGVKPGSAVITVTTADGKKTAKCTVTVMARVTSVRVPQTNVYLKKGASTTLKAVPVTADGSSARLNWVSSAPKTVSVTSKGKIKALKSGKATITATADNGKTAKIVVNVGGKAPKSVKVTNLPKKNTMKIGETLKLKLAVSPKNAQGVLTFKTSAKGIVSVDAAGQMTAQKKGTATITVSLGKKTAQFKIKVVK